jgi:hypothetical protein
MKKDNRRWDLICRKSYLLRNMESKKKRYKIGVNVDNGWLKQIIIV